MLFSLQTRHKPCIPLYKPPWFRSIANNNTLGKRDTFSHVGAYVWAQCWCRDCWCCQQQIAQMTVVVELVAPSPLPPSLTLTYLGSATLGLIKSRGKTETSWHLILYAIATRWIHSSSTPYNAGWIVWTLITSVNLSLLWVIPAQKPFSLMLHEQSSERFLEQVGSKCNR